MAIYIGNKEVGKVYRGKSEISEAFRGRSKTFGFLDGSTPNKAAPSAQALQDIGLTEDGVYWIDLPTAGPTQVYCILDSNYDGGGWMLSMKATRGTTFSYYSNYWTSINTLSPTQTNLNDGDAKYHTFNYFPGTDLMARWPDLSQGGCINYGGAFVWLENDFPSYISETSSTLVNLFNTADRNFIQDAKTWCGWTGFSGQTDVRFYGFNYRALGTDTRSRWGFGWNENGGGLFPNGNETSPDVSGGIGLIHRGGVNYSAGDYIGCCQNPTGFNRSARVEVYIR